MEGHEKRQMLNQYPPGLDEAESNNTFAKELNKTKQI
jgi:hypothetical protein